MPVREPLVVGEITYHYPHGDHTIPIALVIQRRISRRGTETWMVSCPRCGCVHEHGAGEGSRGGHCHVNVRPRGDYEVLDASPLPIVPNDAKADIELRLKGWTGRGGGSGPRLRLVSSD